MKEPELSDSSIDVEQQLRLRHRSSKLEQHLDSTWKKTET